MEENKEKHIFEIDTEWTYRSIKIGATTVKVITVQKVKEAIEKVSKQKDQELLKELGLEK